MPSGSDVPKMWIIAGGRRLSQGILKFVFLSEFGRKHIVFLCGHDNQGMPFVSAELKMKIIARSGEIEQVHLGGTLLQVGLSVMNLGVPESKPLQ